MDVRTPFYAPEVLALVLSLPPGQLLEQRAYLCAHRRRWRALARVGDAARGVAVAWPLALRFAKRVCDVAARRALPRRLVRQRPGPHDYATWLRRERVVCISLRNAYARRQPWIADAASDSDSPGQLAACLTLASFGNAAQIP